MWIEFTIGLFAAIQDKNTTSLRGHLRKFVGFVKLTDACQAQIGPVELRVGCLNCFFNISTSGS